MAEKDSLGALEKLNLTGLDRENIDPEYYRELGKLISPAYERPTGAEVAFNFFAGMTDAASIPGATFAGSASGGARKAGEYLFKENLAEKKRKRELPITGLRLASAMKGKRGQPKAMGTGDFATHMSQEEAQNYWESYGGSVDQPSFKRFADIVVPEDPSEIDTPIFLGNAYSSFTPVVGADGRLISITVSPDASNTGKSALSLTIIEDVKRIANFEKALNPVLTTSLPVAKVLLDKLLVGEVDTNALAPLRKTLLGYGTAIFNLQSDDLDGLQLFESITNKIGPAMRPVGSGSTSDKEFDAYKAAFGTIERTPQANYMSIYSFIRMNENTSKLLRKEKNMLAQGNFGSYQDLQEELAKSDEGIFKKFTLPKGIAPDDASAVDKAKKEWFINVPQGEVIYNVDSNGKTVIQGKDTYYIKGFNLKREKYSATMSRLKEEWGL